jgi:hypothetical protein
MVNVRLTVGCRPAVPSRNSPRAESRTSAQVWIQLSHRLVGYRAFTSDNLARYPGSL